jgi:hypothetical protein
VAEGALHGHTLAVEGLTGAAEQGGQHTRGQSLQLEVEHSFEHIYLKIIIIIIYKVRRNEYE